VSAPVPEARALVGRLLRKARTELAGTPLADPVVQLVEELLLRRFPQLTREEIRAMFDLEDLRKSRVWQEARQEGRAEGREQGRAEGRAEGREQGLEQGQALARKQLIGRMVAKGMTVKQIAALLDLPAQDVRRLACDR
jgi:predicted transposase/invertase (TIGR01784 family)